MSDITLPNVNKLNVSKMSELELSRLADAQGMPLANSDLPQVLLHYTLLAEHAQNVLGFALDEVVEMVGQFRP